MTAAQFRRTRLLILLALIWLCAAQRPLFAQALRGSVTETKAGIANMPMLVSGFAYIAGGAAMLSGAGALKRSAECAQEHPLAPGVARMALGGVVASMPTFLSYVNATLKSEDGRAVLTQDLDELGVPRDNHPIVAGEPPRKESKLPPSQPVERRAPLVGAPEFIPQSEFTPVRLFFATNRKPTSPKQKGTRLLSAFGPDRNDTLSFGEAMVTVPVSERHKTTSARSVAIKLLGFIGVELDENVRKDVVVLSSFATPQHCVLSAAKSALTRGQRFKEQTLVFVHGYNVSFDDALKRAGQLAHDLEFDGPVHVFSWPSNAKDLGYRSDAERAKEAAVHLEDHVEGIFQSMGDTGTIHFIAHSMGAETLMGMLDGYRRANSAQGLRRFGEIIAISPDVSDVYFSRVVSAVNRAKLVRGVTLYASRNDLALKISRNVAFGDKRVGEIEEGGPLIVRGVDAIDTTDANSDWLSLGHSDALDKRHLLADISRLIETGERPPDKRHKAFFERVRTKNGDYWRYRR